MIYPDKIVDDFIDAARENEYFDDKKILRAYPPSVKPTLQKSPCVAVGIKEIRLDEAAVGQSVKRGSVSIFADVYIPFICKNASAEEIVCNLCRGAERFGISSISAGGAFYDAKTECFVTKTAFTFSDEIMIGGYDG